MWQQMQRSGGKDKRQLVDVIARNGYLLLPLSTLFAVGGIWYSIWWGLKRPTEVPCIDCERQREIVQEVYFGKIDKKSKMGRQMP